MKKCAYLLTILVIFALFGLKTYAEEDFDDYISDFEDLLPEDMEGETMDRLSVEGILSGVVESVKGERGRLGVFFLTTLGVICLSALGSLAPPPLSESVSAVVGILSSAALFSTVSSLVSEVLLSLDKISKFFSAFIPISVGVTALGGAEGTALAQGSGMYISLSLLSRLSGGIFSTVSALSLGSALLSPLGGQIVSSFGGMVKSVLTRAMGIFTAILSGAFALQTIVTSSADNAAMRAARYMASGLIPVVGSTVSGALSTLASGMSYAKGIIGGGAVSVLLFFALTPLTTILLYRLCLTAAIGISDMLGADSSRILSAYRSALDIALALYALSTLIYLFEIIIFLKSGVALV